MNRKQRFEKLSASDIDRIIQMAWEDRTAFEDIYQQFGLRNGDVISLMRRELKGGSFRVWRKRTHGQKTKHAAKRPFKVGRFQSPNQKGGSY